MRKLLPIVLLAGLVTPLIGCGGDSDKTDDAKGAAADAADKMDDAADKAADAMEHGTGSGDQDSMGDGGAKGEGKKHE